MSLDIVLGYIGLVSGLLTALRGEAGEEVLPQALEHAARLLERDAELRCSMARSSSNRLFEF